MCFLAKFAKILGMPFFTEPLRWLLLGLATEFSLSYKLFKN